ncbi:uncharacterized protein SAPINGB_P005131 [Magnusiomyces paraingens]|uniref:PPM-type phosphatase domain-containing protein n=1 Tax=Magnusiomyces paraingens TaxID=2606893 RepID=A0A5E8BYF8_9ASCO|nr:uncharacterized protein SAPINGB_P005131 [Saprochaete ingens]VVT56524.1 unnamed protein product [Saprochaete ingens]
MLKVRAASRGSTNSAIRCRLQSPISSSSSSSIPIVSAVNTGAALRRSPSPSRAPSPRRQLSTSSSSSSSSPPTASVTGFRPLARWSSVAVVATSILLAGSYLTLAPRRATISLESSSPFSTSAPFGLPRSSSQQNNKQPITMMTPLQVSARLRELEESYFVERGKGVVRYDVSQLPSNSPIEDDRSEKIVQVPLLTATSDKADSEAKAVSSDWMFWGVYDGHSGWTTSAKLRDALIAYVLSELDKTYVKSTPDSIYRLVPSPTAIDEAIQNGFVRLDNDIVHKSIEKLMAHPDKAGAAEYIAPALSGSCGLLAFYDTFSNNLRVAVTGDSRAVLGSVNERGEWTARALSVDQTGSNMEEAARIRKEHPGEESTVIRRGRVLGMLEPTRAFGDARYKWTRDIQEKMVRYFFGRRVPADFHSPPYVTAKPVVSTAHITPKAGDFLVLGTDGLYEMLTNEEIVGLVVQWLHKKKPDYFEQVQATIKERTASKTLWGRVFGTGSSSSLKTDSSSNSATDGASPAPATKVPASAGTIIKADHSELAVHVRDISPHPESQKQVFRRQPGTTPRFTVEDENIATHLVRNALGGADIQQVSMLVSIPAPISRSYRDDLTVTVVLFGDVGEPNDSGSVRVNEEGTRKNLKTHIKSKL